MLSFLYNFIIINFFFFYFINKLNLKYFKLNNNLFIIFLSYHLFLTAFYVFVFKDGAADYKTYLDLSTIKKFHLRYLTSSDLVNYIVGIFKYVLKFNDLNIITIFSLISFVGINIFIKNLVMIGIEKKVAYILMFLPGIHFWTSIPGKDCLILFFLSCFFYVYLKKKISLSVLFIFLVFLIRPHIGLIFFISILAAELITMKGYKKILIFLLSLFCLYLMLNFSGAKHFFVSDNSISDNLIVQMLMQLQDYAGKYAQSDTYYENSNLLFNVINYIFFPLKFLTRDNSILVNISILIEILSLIFIIHLTYIQKNKLIYDKKIIYFLSICIMIYILIIPQTLFNYGINIRQKWMIIPFLIYFIFLLKNLLVRINRI